MARFRLLLTMAINAKGVISTFRQIEGAANALGAHLQSAREKFADLASSYASLRVAETVKKILVSTVKPAMEIELAMQRIQMVTGATGAELLRMKNAALQIAEITPFGPLEATEALAALARATGSAQAAVQLLGPTARAAMASLGSMGLADAARMAANAIKAFNVSSERAADLVNKLIAASFRVGVPIETFAKITSRMGMMGSVAEQTAESVIQVMSILARYAPNAERATRMSLQLFRLFTQLATSPEISENFANALGIPLTDEATNRMRDMRDILVDVAKAYVQRPDTTRAALLKGGMSTSSYQALVPLLTTLSKGLQTMGGSTVTGAAAFDYLTKAMSKGMSKAQEITDSYMRTLSALINQLKESWETFRMTFGEPLLTILRPLVYSLTFTVQALTALVAQFIKLGGGTMFKALGLLAGFNAALFVLRTTMYGVFSVTRVVINQLPIALNSMNIFKRGILATSAAFSFLLSSLRKISEHLQESSVLFHRVTVDWVQKAGMTEIATRRIGMALVAFSMALRATLIGAALYGIVRIVDQMEEARKLVGSWANVFREMYLWLEKSAWSMFPIFWPVLMAMRLLFGSPEEVQRRMLLQQKKIERDKVRAAWEAAKAAKVTARHLELGGKAIQTAASRLEAISGFDFKVASLPRGGDAARKLTSAAMKLGTPAGQMIANMIRAYYPVIVQTIRQATDVTKAPPTAERMKWTLQAAEHTTRAMKGLLAYSNNDPKIRKLVEQFKDAIIDPLIQMASDADRDQTLGLRRGTKGRLFRGTGIIGTHVTSKDGTVTSKSPGVPTVDQLLSVQEHLKKIEEEKLERDVQHWKQLFEKLDRTVKALERRGKVTLPDGTPGLHPVMGTGIKPLP